MKNGRSTGGIVGISRAVAPIQELVDADDRGLVVALAHHRVPALVDHRLGRAAADATQCAQVPDLALEPLAEGVVDERVVDSGALGEEAWQQGDLRRQGVAAAQDVPQVHQAVRRPADDEARADQDGDLRKREE